MDTAGNVYVTGGTGSSAFPTTAGALQTSYGGGLADSFLIKLNPAGSTLLYSTYLGGAGYDYGLDIGVDTAGNIYVTGVTGSTNFPTTPGAFQTHFGGSSSDAFIAKIAEDPIGPMLTFPLQNRTPDTARINTVFDHSMPQQYCPDDIVVAYTGEEGRREFGASTFSQDFGCGPLHGFKNHDGTNFDVNGHYSGGGEPQFLFYDGHPGYDYRTKDPDQDPIRGRIEAFAAAPGVVACISLRKADGADIDREENTSNCTEGRTSGEIKIDHQNGYFTIYLHLSSANVHAGDTVVRGQKIGVTGETGAPGAPHLHFEVRRNIGGILVPVDPYGWEGAASDPYTRATNVNLWLPGTPGPSLTLSINTPSVHKGDTLTLTAIATPGPTPVTADVSVTADVYIALQLPGCTSLACILFWQGGLNFTATPQPVLRNWPISAFNEPIFSYTFNGNELGGSYVWLGAFAVPGTGNLISGITQAPFTFSP